jgi:molybdate transport system regulatory protein
MPATKNVSPRIKGWFALGDEFLMGPRYVRLLEAIDETGSIRAACKVAGVSYRTCLNRLRQMERVMGHVMVETTRGGAKGGGASLTAESRHLVQVYRSWRADLAKLSDRAFAEAMRGTGARRR